MLEAGKLRHRLVIQKPVETQDSVTGAMAVNWQEVATVWSAIEPLSAKEFIAAQVENSQVSARITVRYRSDLTHEMRLYHAAKDKIYKIEGLLSDKKSGLEYLTIPCSEGIRYDDPAGGVVPVNLEVPEISGNPQDGQTLSANTGIWANDPTEYARQWYVNDLAVVGATAATWIVDADVDDIITFGVTASNVSGDGEEAFSDGVVIIS